MSLYHNRARKVFPFACGKGQGSRAWVSRLSQTVLHSVDPLGAWYASYTLLLRHRCTMVVVGHDVRISCAYELYVRTRVEPPNDVDRLVYDISSRVRVGRAVQRTTCDIRVHPDTRRPRNQLEAKHLCQTGRFQEGQKFHILAYFVGFDVERRDGRRTGTAQLMRDLHAEELQMLVGKTGENDG